jgi:adenosylcobinamide-phosphate synthase
LTGGRRVLVLALAIDALFGEVPSWAHPVAGMGCVLTSLEKLAPAGRRGRLVYGAGVAIGVPLVWGWVAGVLEHRLPWVVQALVLKPAFAGRALLDAGRDVEVALQRGRLAEARTGLRALVSRPTTDLDASQVSAAAIESLAENFVDSWLAPLAMYALGGLPWAYAYRAANTADAMWGYHTTRHEYLGKAAARLDDVLNFVPARLGALLLVLVAPDRRGAVRVWWTDAARTQSPNAGQSMAAAAGGLGLRLEKSGHYVLHDGAADPTPNDIHRARRLARQAMFVAAALCLIARR